MRFKLLFLLLITILLHGEPWGKDSDLASYRFQRKCTPRPQSPLQAISKQMIGFHQNVISPADGPRSHYRPSSSQYTLDAICKYGFFKGFFLGCDRLMRENNDLWVYPTIETELGPLKHDPVR